MLYGTIYAGTPVIAWTIPDGMLSPEFMKGDVVFIKPHGDWKDADDVITCTDDDSLTIRKVILTDNGVELRPYNDPQSVAKYESREEAKRDVHGLVVGVERMSAY